ncbi:caspase family protein [Caballeronia sordidicola]|uniref:caspase family protein n=1 Tax=Caballeronia sordidicola TaxID=196367 RepID=UPI00068D1CB9|nr:caspase family protein [Caballeronia sordidicola]
MNMLLTPKHVALGDAGCEGTYSKISGSMIKSSINYKNFFLIIIFCLSILSSVSVFGQSLKMVALVIGNDNYQSVPALANPGNDADLVGATLQRVGFQLIGGGAVHDLTLQDFQRDVNDFATQAASADVAAIYYAGHGLQLNGENYLVPVDANPGSAADVPKQMISATNLLNILNKSNVRLKFLILDACRNNPFASRGLSFGGSGLGNMSRGLAQLSGPEGTMIWYATQPGNVAQDGSGNNGPFALAISHNLGVKGRDVYAVFNATGIDVKNATHDLQEPWLAASALSGDFYFVSNVTGRSLFVDPVASQPSVDRLAKIFSGGVSIGDRKFSFGENYIAVNNSLDAPFAIPKYTGLPRAGEYGNDDVRYFWVPVSSLPSLVSTLLPDGVGNHCIAPDSYFVFFFKDEKLFHISMRFGKSGACTSYDWVWSSLFPDEKRTEIVKLGGLSTSIVAHELPDYSVLDVTRLGVANNQASIFHE